MNIFELAKPQVQQIVSFVIKRCIALCSHGSLDASARSRKAMQPKQLLTKEGAEYKLIGVQMHVRTHCLCRTEAPTQASSGSVTGKVAAVVVVDALRPCLDAGYHFLDDTLGNRHRRAPQAVLEPVHCLVARRLLLAHAVLHFLPQ